ncbi:glutamate and aspartate transporter subunit; periplasmic-binding component of ABC superfamily [Bradyrhizobium sp. ORS 285]|uniref:amino acid ABC transporter substrate-binding protein n=1 Tax=Bradyrhizobium sp. ORS 285 TaxID=115808 RepID=UPI0002408ED3|nr:amino acid ABC transporter substrate-binding protein [Bradyrhizobium sp. ORS 285]CCD84547.1 glutamate and aspartate transporter subunit; periplasmic-binding component of ABC superfamily [Bradyrhizobium sp. ORS 285]SMX57528.1 glutamate and aspartate transporter subunit; periplasmic-binding component of ABC superfamily [Bradyrhizobium sp. ORS 285]
MRRWGCVLALVLAANAAGAEELSGTLQKIKETGKIAVAFQEAAVPFSYLDGNQKPVGYALDICARIADAVKRELGLPNLVVETVPVTSSTRIPLMTNGTIDLLCASTTNNAERQKLVTFTNTHFLSATRFAAKTSSSLRRIDDLKGKTAVAIAGSTNIAQLNKVNVERKLGITIVPAKDQAEAFLMLETDRAQAYVLDDVQLAVAIARSKEPAAYVISEDAFSKAEPFGIMLRKDDAPFKAIADRVTAELYQSPEIEKLYKTWFESPVPPTGTNFNYPMPAALRAGFKKPSSSPDPEAYAAE